MPLAIPVLPAQVLGFWFRPPPLSLSGISSSFPSDRSANAPAKEWQKVPGGGPVPHVSWATGPHSLINLNL